MYIDLTVFRYGGCVRRMIGPCGTRIFLARIARIDTDAMRGDILKNTNLTNLPRLGEAPPTNGR